MCTQCPANVVVGYPPAGIDLVLYRGDDFAIELQVAAEDGTPVDLTGATATAEIRAGGDDPSVLASFTATVDESVVTLRLSHAVTAALPVDAVAVWDVQVTTTADQVTTIAGGRVQVLADVTA